MTQDEGSRPLVLRRDVVAALRELGATAGQTLMVHTSLGSIGFVCGGAQTIIEALLEVVGESGTIMMPTQSWKNLDPSTGVHGDVPREWWQTIRDEWPAYDPRITPTNTMGAVAEMFRSWPGARRSAHPARSVAAVGARADWLTRDHDLSNITGEGSPVGRLYELGGSVLLIGVGYDKCTSLHLADERASWPGKHTSVEHSAVVEGGRRVWRAYETLAVDGEDFSLIGEAFELACPNALRTTQLGAATLRLVDQRELVDFAVAWIERHRGRPGNRTC